MVDCVTHNLKNIRVYIFNVTDDREFSEKDVKLLEETFGKFGECVTVKTTSGSKKCVENKFSELEKDVDALKNADGVIVVAMSHSSNSDQIYRTFYKPLRVLEALKGKFVLLISQGCRGSDKLFNRDYDGDATYHILWFSTADGAVAIRTPEGSPFIKGVCKNLDDGARAGIDIEAIVRNSQFHKSIQPNYVKFFNVNCNKFYLPRIGLKQCDE